MARNGFSARYRRLAGSIATVTAVAVSGTLLLISPAAATPGSLVFATFNVCKVNCAAPAPSWDVRRDRVGRVIGESNADVIGLQEATNNPTSTAKTQVEDIKNIVAPHGYVPINVAEQDNECRRPRDENGQLAGPSPCENTAMLIYRSSTVQPFQPPTGSGTGRILASSIAGGLDTGSSNRSVEWAYLQGVNGTGPFLAVVMHTDSDKAPAAEASRVAIANSLGPWASSLNANHGMTGTPVVLMADLNSFEKRQPNGAQKVLTNTGWLDAFTAPAKTNIRYSTINYNPRLADGSGFPANAYLFRPTKKNPLGAATRIDYIMAYGGGVRMVAYEHVMYLNGKAFNPDYQASDHQMVKATLAFS